MVNDFKMSITIILINKYITLNHNFNINKSKAKTIVNKNE